MLRLLYLLASLASLVGLCGAIYYLRQVAEALDRLTAAVQKHEGLGLNDEQEKEILEKLKDHVEELKEIK